MIVTSFLAQQAISVGHKGCQTSLSEN